MKYTGAGREERAPSTRLCRWPLERPGMTRPGGGRWQDKNSINYSLLCKYTDACYKHAGPVRELPQAGCSLPSREQGWVGRATGTGRREANTLRGRQTPAVRPGPGKTSLSGPLHGFGQPHASPESALGAIGMPRKFHSFAGVCTDRRLIKRAQ